MPCALQEHGLPVKVVVERPNGPRVDRAYTGQGGTLAASGRFSGLSSGEAKAAIVAELAVQGRGRAHTSYRLRDWLVSRQRYWGAPIPMIHCDSCGAVPVPEQDLPVELPPIQE